MCKRLERSADTQSSHNMGLFTCASALEPIIPKREHSAITNDMTCTKNSHQQQAIWSPIRASNIATEISLSADCTTTNLSKHNSKFRQHKPRDCYTCKPRENCEVKWAKLTAQRSVITTQTSSYCNYRCHCRRRRCDISDSPKANITKTHCRLSVAAPTSLSQLPTVSLPSSLPSSKWKANNSNNNNNKLPSAHCLCISVCLVLVLLDLVLSTSSSFHSLVHALHVTPNVAVSVESEQQESSNSYTNYDSQNYNNYNSLSNNDYTGGAGSGCYATDDCRTLLHSHCNQYTGECVCRSGFVPARPLSSSSSSSSSSSPSSTSYSLNSEQHQRISSLNFVPPSSASHQQLLLQQNEPRICLPVKSLGDNCLSHDQCINLNSLCVPFYARHRHARHSPSLTTTATVTTITQRHLRSEPQVDRSSSIASLSSALAEAQSQSPASFYTDFDVAHLCQCNPGYVTASGVEEHIGRFKEFNVTLASFCLYESTLYRLLRLLMHSSLVALTVISIILIFLMISCFLYFVRAHRKHDAANNNINGGTNIGTDEEAAAIMAAETTMKQQNMSTTKFTSADGNPLHTQSMMYEQPAAMLRPQLSNQAAGYADVPLVAVSPTQQRNLYTNQPIAQQQQQQHQQPQSQPVPASVAQQQSTLVQQQPPQQQRVPVQGPNSQINSAIIGSSEAEFQNDFIQVFPMYQIAPQPEKNTTFANTEYYSAQ